MFNVPPPAGLFERAKQKQNQRTLTAVLIVCNSFLNKCMAAESMLRSANGHLSHCIFSKDCNLKETELKIRKYGSLATVLYTQKKKGRFKYWSSRRMVAADIEKEKKKNDRVAVARKKERNKKKLGTAVLASRPLLQFLLVQPSRRRCSCSRCTCSCWST